MSRLISELGYLGFEVADLPRWETFASQVLGLAVGAAPQPHQRWLRMDEHRYRFILTEGPSDDCVFAGWQVQNGVVLDAYAKHLDGLGVRWSWASDQELMERCVQRMLQFTDPAGNRHEIYCGPPLASDRFASPKVAGGFVTRDEGLGHIVYSSSAYAQTLDFATKVLDLGASDTIRVALAPGVNFDVSFFHANRRHHSFAVAPQPPGPGPHQRIHHFMIEVNSIEEVGFARDRCLAMGQAVHMDIGQHPNDRMISFYGQTPSGFFVEFGWGGVKVEESSWRVRTYDRLSEWGHRPNGEVKLRTSGRQAAEVPSLPANSSWKVVINTPMGDNQVTFDFTVDGGTLSGAIEADKETNDIREGKVDGGTLTWRSKVNSPIAMDLEFSATIEGDRISGGAKSPFGTAPFSGTRA